MQTTKLLNEFMIPIPSLNIQQSIIDKINLLNEQSSHYESYAQALQEEIDQINQTIQNMTNSNNGLELTDKLTDDLTSVEQNEILVKLGLEIMPDYDDLLREVELEEIRGKRLLAKLNKTSETDSEAKSDTETEIINRVAKSKQTTKKLNKTNSVQITYI